VVIAAVLVAAVAFYLWHRLRGVRKSPTEPPRP